MTYDTLLVDYKYMFVLHLLHNPKKNSRTRSSWRYSSSSILPSSMYHKDRTPRHIASSPQSLILGTGMYLCNAVYSSFCFIDYPLSALCIYCFSQITRVLPIRPRHRQQAHSVAQGNQLCTSSSWRYQIAIKSCTKSRASSFCPLHICCERGGRSQPPAERSSCSLIRLPNDPYHSVQKVPGMQDYTR